MSKRLRVATHGFRGSTTNRRVSIATFGFHPLGILEVVWRNVKDYTLNLTRVFSVTLEK